MRFAALLTVGALCASLPARADHAPIVLSPVETTDPHARPIEPDAPPPAPRPKRSHVPDYIALGVTGVLAGGAVFGFVRHRQIGRLLLDDVWKLDVDFDRHQRLKNQADMYKSVSIALFAGTIVSTAVTAALFTRHRAPAFGVVPTGDGGSVTYGGAF
jgi:hypothetical protein